jgi:Acetyltransferase (GNAT) family
MHSLYAEYLSERTEDSILENDKGFITWRYINPDKVYIVDIYIRKEFRCKKAASELADCVCDIARNIGYKELLGSVVPSTKGSNASLRVLWGYGMVLHSADKDLIIMRKDI